MRPLPYASEPFWRPWRLLDGRKPPVDSEGRLMEGWQQPPYLTLAEAQAVVAAGNADGVGLVWVARAGMQTWIDVDGCITEDGSVKPEAQFIIDAAKRHGVPLEYSPSRKGLHGYGRGISTRFEVSFKSNPAGEVYDLGLFLTFTGDTFQDGDPEADVDAFLTEVHQHYRKPEAEKPKAREPKRKDPPLPHDGVAVMPGHQERAIFRELSALRGRGFSEEGAVAAIWAEIQAGRFPPEPGKAPWTLRDVQNKARHVWGRYEPGAVDDDETKAENIYKIEKMRADARARIERERRAEGARELPKILSLRERLALPARPKEWRIQSWQQMGHRVMFSAQFKAGKTTTVANVVRSLVDGTPFLDQWAVSPVQGKVALLDFEMAEEDRGQLDDWYRDLHIENLDRVLLIPFRGRAQAFDLMDDATLARWAKLLRDHGVEYLAADCLRPILDALGLDEHHDAGAFLVRFDALLVEAGIREALIVHHMGHQQKDNPTERARGDSRILDWPDVNWNLVREQPDDPASARFIKAFGRGVDVPETQLAFSQETRRLGVAGGTRADAKNERLTADVLKVLSSDWMNTRAIEGELPNRAANVRSALKTLVASGKAEARAAARGAKQYRLRQPGSQEAQAPEAREPGADDVPF